MRPYLRKIILVTCGIALSAWLTVDLEARMIGMKLATPGAYVVDYVFGPPWRVGQNILGKVIFVGFVTDFILVFSVLTGLYLLVTKLFVGGNNDRS